MMRNQQKTNEQAVCCGNCAKEGGCDCKNNKTCGCCDTNKKSVPEENLDLTMYDPWFCSGLCGAYEKYMTALKELLFFALMGRSTCNPAVADKLSHTDLMQRLAAWWLGDKMTPEITTAIKLHELCRLEMYLQDGYLNGDYREVGYERFVHCAIWARLRIWIILTKVWCAGHCTDCAW